MAGTHGHNAISPSINHCTVRLSKLIFLVFQLSGKSHTKTALLVRACIYIYILYIYIYIYIYILNYIYIYAVWVCARIYWSEGYLRVIRLTKHISQESIYFLICYQNLLFIFTLYPTVTRQSICVYVLVQKASFVCIHRPMCPHQCILNSF